MLKNNYQEVWGDGHLTKIIYNNVIYIQHGIHNVINKIYVCFVIIEGGRDGQELFSVTDTDTGRTHRSTYRGAAHLKKWF